MRRDGQRGEIGMGTVVLLALVVGAIAAGAFVFTMNYYGAVGVKPR